MGYRKFRILSSLYLVTDELIPSVATRIAKSALTDEQRAALEKKRSDALASVNPSASTRSLLTGLEENSFNVKLSKHLDDFRRGQGYLSKEVVGALYNRSGRTASTLATEDPRSASRYNAYSTGFDYESRARFIQGLSGAASTASTLRELGKKLNRSA